MPAPRASSVAVERSWTVTPQPASRRSRAAVSPPSEPPTTATSGMVMCESGRPSRRSGLAERGDRVDLELEQHPALLERRVPERVLVTAGVLLEDVVELLGDPSALVRVVLGDLARDGRL